MNDDLTKWEIKFQQTGQKKTKRLLNRMSYNKNWNLIARIIAQAQRKMCNLEFHNVRETN